MDYGGNTVEEVEEAKIEKEQLLQTIFSIRRSRQVVVCMNCFLKCTYWFANLKDDS